MKTWVHVSSGACRQSWILPDNCWSLLLEKLTFCVLSHLSVHEQLCIVLPTDLGWWRHICRSDHGSQPWGAFSAAAACAFQRGKQYCIAAPKYAACIRCASTHKSRARAAGRAPGLEPPDRQHSQLLEWFARLEDTVAAAR